MQVLLTREARLEVREATRWYAARSTAAGRNFVAAYRHACDLAAQRPDDWVEIHPGVRRVLLARFPYSLFYAVQPGGILVLAVAHQKRLPRDWESRG